MLIIANLSYGIQYGILGHFYIKIILKPATKIVELQTLKYGQTFHFNLSLFICLQITNTNNPTFLLLVQALPYSTSSFSSHQILKQLCLQRGLQLKQHFCLFPGHWGCL